MSAERIDLFSLLEDPTCASMRSIASRIEAGEVFIYPTDTIYGVGARFDSSCARKKIASIKKREPAQPMILLGARLETFSMLNPTFSPAARQCAEIFWPGLLTMLLPTQSGVEGVAIRVSDHPFVRKLSDILDVPLISTSANMSGVPYDPDPDLIYTLFRDLVDFMIDAGRLPLSQASTIVEFPLEGEPAVLREGCISSKDIASAIRGDFHRSKLP